MSETSPNLAEVVERYSAATLHEAAGGRGALPSDLRPAWAGSTLRGPAFTVFQGPGDNVWLHRAIYQAPTGSVLVVETGDREYGYWGELMTLAARQRGLRGLVIDGGVRDVDAIEALCFPVFASAVCLRGTTKDRDFVGSIGAPIQLGGTRICSGDHIVGDRDGVVALPSKEMVGILALARERDAKESGIREALADGRRLLDLVLPPNARPDGPA